MAAAAAAPCRIPTSCPNPSVSRFRASSVIAAAAAAHSLALEGCRQCCGKGVMGTAPLRACDCVAKAVFAQCFAAYQYKALTIGLLTRFRPEDAHYIADFILLVDRVTDMADFQIFTRLCLHGAQESRTPSGRRLSARIKPRIGRAILAQDLRYSLWPPGSYYLPAQ